MAKQLVSGKLTSKGQLTIPIELRTLLKLEEGDRLEFVLDDNEKIIQIYPKKKKSIRNVMGVLKPTVTIDVEEAIELAKTERAKVIRDLVEGEKEICKNQ